jgi:hypothetical protein
MCGDGKSFRGCVCRKWTFRFIGILKKLFTTYFTNVIGNY